MWYGRGMEFKLKIIQDGLVYVRADKSKGFLFLLSLVYNLWVWEWVCAHVCVSSETERELN